MFVFAEKHFSGRKSVESGQYKTNTIILVISSSGPSNWTFSSKPETDLTKHKSWRKQQYLKHLERKQQQNVLEDVLLTSKFGQGTLQI